MDSIHAGGSTGRMCSGRPSAQDQLCRGRKEKYQTFEQLNVTLQQENGKGKKKKKCGFCSPTLDQELLI